MLLQLDPLVPDVKDLKTMAVRMMRRAAIKHPMATSTKSKYHRPIRRNDDFYSVELAFGDGEALTD